MFIYGKIIDIGRVEGVGYGAGGREGVRREDVNVAEKMALIHSEISEAFEAYRHKNLDGKHGLGEELGDAVQRILHLAGVMNVDIEAEILRKVDGNKSRDWNWDKMNETRV
jgi:NTP pyrophosphatase (non-canonical NTP hydrolase)